MKQLLPVFISENDYLRPPLKWAGGKRWLVPHLKPLWQGYKHRRLVEPLCGGLAVTLGLSPHVALLNDINPHVINFYRCLKNGLVIKLEMANDKSIYYSHRESFNQLIRDGKGYTEEAASYFYFLNRTGYNGLCRFNSKGEFNVPFGSYKKINYTIDFTPYKAVFKNWEFKSSDFDKVPLAEGDFVYADPPYDVEFTKYSKEDFGWEDQIRLAEWLSKHKGPVVLSNQATNRIIELYRKMGFQLTYLKAPRMISCTGDRTPAKEVLAMKGF
ncbi:Dam family site-specific DNA-(adenine-N6)-methyltransferase [Candidatus Dojkabacteria bacterium]|nr:Dam family site-specific DNA-(adenine-N6)-methyltransferase [Candidatus Dojkabacteria bacterium]